MNLYVKPHEYEKASETISIEDNSEASRKMNALIHKAKSRAEDIFYDAMLKDRPLTRDSFADKYLYSTKVGDFLKFMEREIEEEAKIKRKSTVKNYYKTLRKLRSVYKFLPFQEVNLDSVKKLQKQLLSDGYETNTIGDFHKIFKKFINIAIQKGDLHKNPYENFNIRFARTKREFLNQDELQILLDIYNTPSIVTDAHYSILRYFLFMCFSGLRFQDLANLKTKDIKDGYLDFRPLKTKDIKMGHRIEINPILQRLIEESLNSPFKKKNQKVFDCITLQKTNVALKSLAAKAGIMKNLSCHVGRHTFATNFLTSGGKIEVLKEILGHSDIKTTMIYVHMVDKQRKEMMNTMSQNFKF